ncbi:alpha/beta hydrolase [Fulvivirga sp. 29W222]|uniref:Alpha/beta hydrolase n=1 Tax=Fulvivirga marina TaxID=2494733 RepID=A0A937KDG1_9BACT|nr:alpha/beta hydrolase [Fulvivirga marina]MBL6448429.1 alpha/beta hydrolase [Fulvivirga marina]
MTIYGIPGLGADKRVFQYLSLDITPILWLPPKRKETLESYVKRLIAQIDQNKPFILLGVSFGGMVAIEMNKLITPEKTIIISSAATQYELPGIIKLVRKPIVQHVIKILLVKPPPFLANYLFGISTVKGKQLLKSIIRDTDINFLKWAIQQIICWKNVDIPKNLIRIHGDHDKLLRLQKDIKYHAIIKRGGHLTVVEQALEVEHHVRKYL